MKTKKQNEMSQTLIIVIANFFAKVLALLGTCWGWLTAIFLSLIAFFISLKILYITLFVIVMIDFLLGLWIHRKNLQSNKMRETLFKLLLYYTLISLLYTVESVIGVAILYKVVFAIASLVELYSICANSLVIYPNIPFLKLFKKLLTVEISKKIEMEKEEITNILDNK